VSGLVGARLERATFRTSRLLDFASVKELTAHTGTRPPTGRSWC
jgi:hypothetical protein